MSVYVPEICLGATEITLSCQLTMYCWVNLVYLLYEGFLLPVCSVQFLLQHTAIPLAIKNTEHKSITETTFVKQFNQNV